MNQLAKKGHGTRKHVQTLLQQHRGKLFVELLQAKGIKPSNWLREQAYYFLEENLPEELYSEAKAKDESEWRQVVQNRLAGKAISRIIKTIRA
tara:strand:+ start:217 stop:495 length:279 start_codon:yes stop_codon:yes gene_type:complete